MAANRDVIVSGLGAVSAVAHDCPGLLDAVLQGRCGIGPIRRFDTSGFDVHLGAEVKGWPEPGGLDDEAMSRLCLSFSLSAAREALDHAGLDGEALRLRTGLVFGTGLVRGVEPLHLLARALADELGLGGPVVTVSTACSSSTGALGVARDLLALGAADHVVAGGADVLTPSVFAGFHALGVLSDQPCAPFSTPFGTTLGEGAGFMVLESPSRARARGTAPIARLSGYGLSADAFHETSPDPEGRGVARALQAALADAGVGPDAVGYVNAHGSGTESNDASEWRGIERGLEGRAVPVSSTKGALGHAQGAAGILEAIVTLLTMERDLMAPTLNFVGARRWSPPDPVGASSPRGGEYTGALCLNSAFGGANAALLLSKPEIPAAPPTPRASLWLLGTGALGAFGLGADALPEPGTGLGPGVTPSFHVTDYSPRTDPRGLDHSSRLLIAATAMALDDAGVRLRGRRRDTTGLLVGAIRPSPESLRNFGDSLEARGLAGLSAVAFARIVLNAAAGFCSKELGIRGPHTALTTGAGSGLAALVLAAEILSTRPGLDRMLAAAVDEVDERSPAPRRERDGAACVLLGRTPGSEQAKEGVRLAGWGLAPPGSAQRASEHALGQEGTVPDVVLDESDFLGCSSPEAGVWATPSLLAVVQGAALVRRGSARTVLVTASRAGDVRTALLLASSERS